MISVLLRYFKNLVSFEICVNLCVYLHICPLIGYSLRSVATMISLLLHNIGALVLQETLASIHLIHDLNLLAWQSDSWCVLSTDTNDCVGSHLTYNWCLQSRPVQVTISPLTFTINSNTVIINVAIRVG